MTRLYPAWEQVSRLKPLVSQASTYLSPVLMFLTLVKSNLGFLITILFLFTACLDNRRDRPVVDPLAGDPIAVEEPTNSLPLDEQTVSIPDPFAEIEDERRLRDLLLEEGQSPSYQPLRMADLRRLQSKLLEKVPDGSPQIKNRPETLPPVWVDGNCPTFSDSFRDVSPEIRLYSVRIDRALDPCMLAKSYSFETALNRLVRGEPTSFEMHGTIYPLREMKDFIALIDAYEIRVEAAYDVTIAPFYRTYSGAPNFVDEIPIPLWLNANPKAGWVVPATHSEVLFEFFVGTVSVPLRIKAYFSDFGFSFDTEEMEPVVWAGRRTIHRFSSIEAKNLLLKSVDVRRAFDAYTRGSTTHVAMSGFGLVGVCNDGAGLLAYQILGDKFVYPYPLARTDLLPEVTDNPIREAWIALTPDVSQLSIDLLDSQSPSYLENLKRRLEVSNPFANETENRFQLYRETLRKMRDSP